MSKLVLLVLCILWCKILHAQPTTFLGKHVDISDFPYHVSVRRNGQHVCSGALVHESWIITAASCVYDSSVPIISVILGNSNLDNFTETASRRELSKIVVHQSFDKSILTNNIALLKMKPDIIPFITHQLPIFLPSSENYHLKDGTTLIVSGWRKKVQDHSGFESQLSVTATILVNQRTCIRSMPSYKAVSGKMFCASYIYPNTEKTCQDDIGAPLANHDVLVGILSSNDGCADTNLPVLYTRVSSFLPWIHKVMAMDSPL